MRERLVEEHAKKLAERQQKMKEEQLLKEKKAKEKEVAEKKAKKKTKKGVKYGQLQMGTQDEDKEGDTKEKLEIIKPKEEKKKEDAAPDFDAT